MVWFFFPQGPRGPRGVPWEYWPDAEAAGFSAAGLEEVISYTRTIGTTGLMVVKGGKVVLEYGDIEARGFMAEGRASVMAMVYGKPVLDGTIDLSLTLEDLGIDDRGGLLPREKKATIEHLLTNRSGVYHPTEFIDPTRGLPPRGSVEPGSYFYFHSWGGLAAREIFTMLTGRDLLQAIGEDLGEPLGLQDFDWRRQRPSRDRSRSVFPLFHLYVSTRDVARFGQLMLQEGKWEGEQLIPRQWVERITTVVTPPEEVHPERYRDKGLGFGYQWWVWHEPDPNGPFVGAYTYIADWGQFLTVLPNLDMVVAHQVFAGWYGAPERSVSFEDYLGVLERIVAARDGPD
jgi:CubicO group peptidase (beta-lactamase class C family)